MRLVSALPYIVFLCVATLGGSAKAQSISKGDTIFTLGAWITPKTAPNQHPTTLGTVVYAAADANNGSTHPVDTLRFNTLTVAMNNLTTTDVNSGTLIAVSYANEKKGSIDANEVTTTRFWKHPKADIVLADIPANQIFSHIEIPTNYRDFKSSVIIRQQKGKLFAEAHTPSLRNSNGQTAAYTAEPNAIVLVTTAFYTLYPSMLFGALYPIEGSEAKPIPLGNLRQNILPSPVALDGTDWRLEVDYTATKAKATDNPDFPILEGHLRLVRNKRESPEDIQLLHTFYSEPLAGKVAQMPKDGKPLAGGNIVGSIDANDFPPPYFLRLYTDINHDGFLDLVISNPHRSAFFLSERGTKANGGTMHLVLKAITPK